MISLLMIDTYEEKRTFTILYDKYKYLMLKVALDVLQDRFWAEDAVHNAFINISKNLNKIEDPHSTATKRYLITITKNSAIDIYRKRKTQMRKEIYIDELQEENFPLSYIETDMENNVLDILKNLPVKYRDIFLLKYSAHMENNEIAKLCGIKESTVRQRIARGKTLIEKALNRLEEYKDETYSCD